MTTFDKREEGFEKQFAHDEELKFKATARRNKLLGLWAAEKLGLSGAEAEDYAKSVVMADFEEAGDHDVLHKIRRDFDAKGVAQSDHQISRTMTEFLAKAVADIKAEAARAGADIMALPGFSFARRLRAGETVFCGWCSMPYPIVAETIGRDGFVAVTLESQHGLWDMGAMLTGIAAVRQSGAAPLVRVPVGDFVMVGVCSTTAPKASSRR